MRGRNPKKVSDHNPAELSRPNGRLFYSPFAISTKEEHLMESSETSFTQQDRMILLRPTELGIVLTFYTVLVKMESLTQKCNGDVLGFFKETGCVWATNGTLCSASAMSLEDLDDCFDLSTPAGCNARVCLSISTSYVQPWDHLNVCGRPFVRLLMTARSSSTMTRIIDRAPA